MKKTGVRLVHHHSYVQELGSEVKTEEHQSLRLSPRWWFSHWHSWALQMETWGSPRLLSSASFTCSLWRLLFSASLILQLSQDPGGNRTTVSAVTAAVWKIQHSLGQVGRAWGGVGGGVGREREREHTRVHTSKKVYVCVWTLIIRK